MRASPRVDSEYRRCSRSSRTTSCSSRTGACARSTSSSRGSSGPYRSQPFRRSRGRAADAQGVPGLHDPGRRPQAHRALQRPAPLLEPHRSRRARDDLHDAAHLLDPSRRGCAREEIDEHSVYELGTTLLPVEYDPDLPPGASGTCARSRSASGASPPTICYSVTRSRSTSRGSATSRSGPGQPPAARCDRARDRRRPGGRARRVLGRRGVARRDELDRRVGRADQPASRSGTWTISSLIPSGS